MATKELPLYAAFRRHLADQPEVWEASQSSLRAFSRARAQRAAVLRLVLWSCLGALAVGIFLRLVSVGPVWLNIPLFGLALLSGWALSELRRQARRKKPHLLPQLLPQFLPEATTAFLKQWEEKAFWLDASNNERPIRMSAFEPVEALMVLSADPDIYAQALPAPKDMTDPEAVIEYPADVDADATPASTPLSAEAPAAALTTVDAEVENRESEILDDGSSAMYRRGFIKRSWTVYAADLEPFEKEASAHFAPELAGADQEVFHTLIAIHVAWSRSPRMTSPSNIAASTEQVFAERQAVGLIPGHVTVPDRRSIDRLIWEERAEFTVMHEALRKKPKPDALDRRSAKRRKQGLTDQPQSDLNDGPVRA
jgi:hypothetical protein